MARYLLQKQKESKEVFTSMNDIASLFVSELRAAVDTGSLSAFAAVLDMVEPPLPEKLQANTVAQAKSQAKAQAKATAGGTHLPLYDLNSRGEVISGVGRLRALGFDFGSTVAFATALDGSSGDCIFVITGVSVAPEAICLDGSSLEEVHLRAVGGREQTARLPVERFLSDAKHASSGASLIKHPGWPQARTVNTDSAQRLFAQARVLFALEILSSLVGSNIEELVDIFLKPSRQVRAKKDLAIGELRAVPEALSVKFAEGTQAEAFQGRGSCAEAFLGGEMPGQGRKIFLCGSVSSESVCPYWCFERTAEASEVNLVQVYYAIQLVGGPDPSTETPQSIGAGSLVAQSGTRPKASPAKAPESIKRTVAALASGSSEAILKERYVYLPVLVNSEAVKAGTELKFVKEPGTVLVKAHARAIGVPQLAKRAKLA